MSISTFQGGFVFGIDNDVSFYQFQSLNGICFEAQIFSSFFLIRGREAKSLFPIQMNLDSSRERSED